jgi:hypothetical protein
MIPKRLAARIKSFRAHYPLTDAFERALRERGVSRRESVETAMLDSLVRRIELMQRLLVLARRHDSPNSLPSMSKSVSRALPSTLMKRHSHRMLIESE